MPNLNKVILIGNLTQKPTLRQTKSGISVANFSLAINQRYKGADDQPADEAKEETKTRKGEKKEKVCFVDIVVWDTLAEACAKYLNKGEPALVEGSLQLRTWQQEEKTRYKLEVVAQNIQFLKPRNAKL
jgi:single-strand DNA-binding protein